MVDGSVGVGAVGCDELITIEGFLQYACLYTYSYNGAASNGLMIAIREVEGRGAFGS